MTAPTYVGEAYESSWTSTTSPKTSSSISVTAGDLLVVVAGGSSSNGALTISDSAGLSWTTLANTTSGKSPIRAFYAVVATTGTLTVTITRASGSSYWGFNVVQFRNHGGVGATNKTASGSSAPSFSFTTTGASSAIVYINGDVNSGSASGTWRSVNGAPSVFYEGTPGATFHAATWTDAGAAGAKTLGLSDPSQSWSAIAVEVLASTVTRVSSTLNISRNVAGRVTATLDISRQAFVARVTSALGVSRQAVSRVQSSLAVSRAAASYGTWSELILTPQWLDAVAARTRELSARAELVDAQGTPQPIIIDGTPQTDLPLAGASVTFSGEDAVQWSASLSWAHPWMVPTTATHPLWGARSLFVRLWWRIYSGGAWLEMPVCTVAIGDTSATDDGTISGTTKGRDVLSLLRGGYGAPLTVSGMTIDVALRAIFERCAPTLPVRIFPTTVTVPATLTLGEQDPLKDALELAAIGYTDGTVRSDREGVVVCGPRPEPVSPVLDWQEGPDCPVPEMTRQHGIEHMGNRITVSSTHVDAVGLYVTVEDDDPSSPTYVGGPWGVHPLPGIETDKATTAAALRSIGLMQLGRGLKPTEDVDVTVPQRPDLTYRHPVKLARALVGVAGVHEVSSWSLTLPASGAVPAPMKVGMMRRYVR